MERSKEDIYSIFHFDYFYALNKWEDMDSDNFAPRNSWEISDTLITYPSQKTFSYVRLSQFTTMHCAAYLYQSVHVDQTRLSPVLFMG